MEVKVGWVLVSSDHLTVSAPSHRLHLPQRRYGALTVRLVAPARTSLSSLSSTSYTAQAARLFPLVMILYFQNPVLIDGLEELPGHFVID